MEAVEALVKKPKLEAGDYADLVKALKKVRFLWQEIYDLAF